MTSSTCTMDPRLWGDLQHHIGLENVYLRLPLRDFFRLRGVCKDWNTLAQQRRCFTEVIQKPYFAIVYPVTVPGIPYHAGLLTFHIASGQWKWKPLPVDSTQLNPLYVPFSVKGLVFSSIGDLHHIVYDAHAKRRYDIRMKENMVGRPRVLGMAVDASVMPYTFQLVLGGIDIDTLVCEGGIVERFGFMRMRNGAWETRAGSRIPAEFTGKRWPSCMKSCLQCKDRVYIWWQTDMILVYSLPNDTWTTLKVPAPGPGSGLEENHAFSGFGGALGVWDGRLFVVMEDALELSISVWELTADESKHENWELFSSSVSEMRAWLVPQKDDSIRVLASFCDQYVLIYTLLGRYADKTGISDNFILFNLETKQWEKTSLWERTDRDTDCLEDTRRPRYGIY